MACTQETVLSPMMVVWSKRDNVNNNDHVLLGPLPAMHAAKVRVTVETRHLTPQCQLTVFYEYSDDGDTWSGKTTLGSAITSDDTTYGSGFTDITSGRKRLVRFGVRVINTSGTELEVAHVAIRVDMQAG